MATVPPLSEGPLEITAHLLALELVLRECVRENESLRARIARAQHQDPPRFQPGSFQYAEQSDVIDDAIEKAWRGLLQRLLA